MRWITKPVYVAALIFFTGLSPEESAVLAFDSPKVITTAYDSYSLYDGGESKSDAESECSDNGLYLASFASNAEFQALLTAIAGDSDVNGENFWINPTVVSSTPYFGSEPVTGTSWYDDEPNLTCGAVCCYGIEPASSFPTGLADLYCSDSLPFICVSTAPAPVTAATTTTTTATTTTTTATTTTSEATTTTTAPTTTTTVAPTTTTDTTTTATTTTSSTTAAPTTTVTSPTTTTATDSTTTASTTVVTTAAALITAPPVVEDEPALSTGQQMLVLYLGLVLGIAVGLSCVCTCFWVGVNRYRKNRRARKYPDPQDAENESESSDEDEKDLGEDSGNGYDNGGVDGDDATNDDRGDNTPGEDEGYDEHADDVSLNDIIGRDDTIKIKSVFNGGRFSHVSDV